MSSSVISENGVSIGPSTGPALAFWAMVSKILKILSREGILDSQRGVNGGYSLARKPQDLTVSEIIAAERGVPVAEVGYYRIRPPIKPIVLGELAELQTGEASGD